MLSELVGRVLTEVEVVRDGNDDQIIFKCEDRTSYRMYHYQDCCESVFIEDICGDVNDLVGTPILVAEESTNRDPIFNGPHGDTLLKAKFLQGSKLPEKPQYVPESETWTFYKFRTIKGSVDIRWHGSSNGYYGESVNFERINNSDN